MYLFKFFSACILIFKVQNVFCLPVLGNFGSIGYNALADCNEETTINDGLTSNSGLNIAEDARTTTGISGFGSGLSNFGLNGIRGYLGAWRGGVGQGKVSVLGELPAVGNAVLSGIVPILGDVQFIGTLPACGSVIITGRCNCGCNARRSLFGFY